jgi:hypothetical protein
VSGALLYAPPWPVVRWFFALAQVLALAVIARFAAAQGRVGGRVGSCLLAVSCLAVSAHCTTLGVGQVGTLVVALLCLAHDAASTGRPGIAGLLVGVANLKPSIAGPFLLPFLIRPRRRTWIGAGAYLLLASAVAWWATATPPHELLRQMLWGAAILQEAGSGLHRLLPGDVAHAARTPLLLAVTVSVATLGLLRRLGGRPLLQHFAVAAVAGRLWTYHRDYDNGMLLFLLVAVGRLALERGSPWRLLAFLAVGASLWAPARLTAAMPVPLAQHLVWIAGLAWLLVDGRELRSPATRATLAPALPSPGS